MSCFTHSTSLSIELETTCSRKPDRKERYWGQQFWQMERDSLVRPTEMTRPVTVDHLQSWSRIFRSDQTEMVRSIWWTKRNFRTFGLNGKRPLFSRSDRSEFWLNLVEWIAPRDVLRDILLPALTFGCSVAFRYSLKRFSRDEMSDTTGKVRKLYKQLT